jgi:hypothetical protein
MTLSSKVRCVLRVMGKSVDDETDDEKWASERTATIRLLVRVFNRGKNVLDWSQC